MKPLRYVYFAAYRTNVGSSPYLELRVLILSFVSELIIATEAAQADENHTIPVKNRAYDRAESTKVMLK